MSCKFGRQSSKLYLQCRFQWFNRSCNSGVHWRVHGCVNSFGGAEEIFPCIVFVYVLLNNNRYCFKSFISPACIPPPAISCQVPSGYNCGAVSGGSSTTTCASPSCDNGYSGSPSAGAAACTTGTGYWSLSGCTGRLRLKCVTRGTRRFRRTCFFRQPC